MTTEPYYRTDLALIHHLGFSHHAPLCAPGILDLLAPVRARGGLVVELGCGSGLLTGHLVSAGHRVIATDASPSMLALAAQTHPEVDFRRLTMPDDPVPEADAVVAVGHPMSYLPDPDSIDRALIAAARALRPGGVLAVDICDLQWGVAFAGRAEQAWIRDEWVLCTKFSRPSPESYVREMTTFVREQDGRWRRDDEVHHNILIDTARIPALLAAEGVQAEVTASFGSEELASGLMAVVGRKA